MNTIRSEQQVQTTTAGSQIPCVTSDLLRPEDPPHGMTRGPRNYERSMLWTMRLPKALCCDTKNLSLLWQSSTRPGMPEKSYAKEFIADVRKADRCDWCWRDARKNRRGLCRHCNEIRKDLERLEKRTAEGTVNFILDWNLRVARREKEDCIAWGNIGRGILDRPVSGLDLEHWFCDLAKRLARDRKMHYGTANILGWTFTPEQRQVLAYLFWEIFGAEASHNRKGRATGRVSIEGVK